MELKVQDIRKSYRNNMPLKQISFEAERGMCVGILGRNGSGKSTLLSILAGIQRCDAGSFFWKGRNLFEYRKELAASVGYVPQGTPLLDELNARDNLLLWYSRKEMNEELDHGILAMLGIDSFLTVPVHRMSGGMKKRLSIGCAAAKKPPILLLDEPSAALDLPCRSTIREYLKTCKSNGSILILTTHDAEELELCDVWFILRDGFLVPYEYHGDVSDLAGRL